MLLKRREEETLKMIIFHGSILDYLSESVVSSRNATVTRTSELENVREAAGCQYTTRGSREARIPIFTTSI